MQQSRLSALEHFVVANAENVLAEIGTCYFTRPFRDGQSGTRFLSANEVYFIFAQDFGIIPGVWVCGCVWCVVCGVCVWCKWCVCVCVCARTRARERDRESGRDSWKRNKRETLNDLLSDLLSYMYSHIAYIKPI